MHPLRIAAVLLPGIQLALADTSHTTDASATDDPFDFTVTGSRFPGSTDPPDNDSDSDSSSLGSSSSTTDSGDSTSTDDPFHFTVTGSRFPGSTDPPENGGDGDSGGGDGDDNVAGIHSVNKGIMGIAALLGFLAA